MWAKGYPILFTQGLGLLWLAEDPSENPPLKFSSKVYQLQLYFQPIYGPVYFAGEVSGCTSLTDHTIQLLLLHTYLNGSADRLAVQETVLGGQNGLQIEVVARQGVGLSQGEAVPLVFSIEAEGETQHKVVGVNGRSIIENELALHSLPRGCQLYDTRNQALRAWFQNSRYGG